MSDPMPAPFKIASAEANQHNGGVQYVYSFPNGYGASVIRTRYSYGHEGGLWELAVLRGNSLCYDTPVTSDVLGHQTEADIDAALEAIAALPAVPA